jgi:hypothetical protein
MYELAFWGGTTIKYRRTHKTLDDAQKEARRVHRKMNRPAAHPATISGPDGKEFSVMW